MLLVATTATAACGDPDDGAATAALEATTSATNEGLFVLASTSDAMAGTTPIAAAVAARATLRALFTRCAVVQSVDVAHPDPTVVEVEFTNCAGFQWVRLEGTLTLTFSSVPTGLQVHVMTSGLRINGGTLTADATVVRSEATGPDGGTVITLEGSARSTWVTPRGITVQRAGMYDFSWERGGSQCLGLSGDWMLDVAGERYATRVAGYRRCGTHCPQAGGSIEMSRANGEHITVLYPGGTTAEWSVRQGSADAPVTRGGVADLACMP